MYKLKHRLNKNHWQNPEYNMMIFPVTQNWQSKRKATTEKKTEEKKYAHKTIKEQTTLKPNMSQNP